LRTVGPAHPDPAPLLRPQALAGEGCIEWFRPTDQQVDKPAAGLLLASIACAALVPAIAAGIGHARTVVLDARIGAPECPASGGPCVSSVAPSARDARAATALSAGDRLEVSFADGAHRTLTVVRPAEDATRPRVEAAWPVGEGHRQGPARIASTRRASLLDWVGRAGRPGRRAD
jgi:hypothetical protein